MNAWEFVEVAGRVEVTWWGGGQWVEILRPSCVTLLHAVWAGTLGPALHFHTRSPGGYDLLKHLMHGKQITACTRHVMGYKRNETRWICFSCSYHPRTPFLLPTETTNHSPKTLITVYIYLSPITVIIRIFTLRKMRWVELLARREQNINAYKCFVWTPAERARRIWEDNIKVNLKDIEW
jgi:hypothetical protein